MLSDRELASRHDVAIEQYSKSVIVEALTTVEMATTLVLPAAIRYQTELASNAAALKSIGYEFDASTLDEVCNGINAMQASLKVLRECLAHDGGHSEFDEAVHCCKAVVPATLAVRKAADVLEAVVADNLWPLPTYQEMLFIL